jgi:hypothetical protein
MILELFPTGWAITIFRPQPGIKRNAGPVSGVKEEGESVRRGTAKKIARWAVLPTARITADVRGGQDCPPRGVTLCVAGL